MKVIRFVLASLVTICFATSASRAAEGDDVAALKKSVEELRAQLKSANAFNKGDVLSVLKVTTSKEEADAFVKTFQESPKESHKMKGFRGLAVAENTKVPGSFVVISVWENEDALNGYVKSKAFGDDHEKSGQIKSAQMEPPARYVVKDN
jgi:heme-degrading monooxygenase HmoA